MIPGRLDCPRAVVSCSCHSVAQGLSPGHGRSRGLLPGPETRKTQQTKEAQRLFFLSTPFRFKHKVLTKWKCLENRFNISFSVAFSHPSIKSELMKHLFARYRHMISEHCPQHTRIARRSCQRPVVAIILIQTCRQQRPDVETGHLHSLICGWNKWHKYFVTVQQLSMS